MKLTAVAACITAMTCLNVSPAKGTETQVWVSSSGKNTGECLITAPCATLQYAYGQAPAGGAINIANSGSYGPIIIKKPISIIAADGVDALIGVAPGSIGGIYKRPEMSCSRVFILPARRSTAISASATV